ncbi:hypothetical protein L9F63_002611, partial [Diploptera punctata]
VRQRNIIAINSTNLKPKCGQPEVPAFRVMGGEESLPGRWPWMAAIFRDFFGIEKFFCGGSLIGPLHILTAAHCAIESSSHQMVVRLGDVDLMRNDEPSAPDAFRIAEVRKHPKYGKKGHYHDLAILVLDRAPRRSRYVMPLCLPPPSARSVMFVGRMATAVGWGRTSPRGSRSTVQRQTELPVWRNYDCGWRYFRLIYSSFLCAGGGRSGKDTCKGDSGGPLMLKYDGRWIQIGITSHGMDCGKPFFPGVYIRVTEYMDWIEKNIRE